MFRRSAPLAFGLFSAVIAPSAARAQLPPLEATRPGPHPQRVAPGDVMVYARAFSAARDGARVLVVYIENQGTSAPLRSALFNLDTSRNDSPSLTRAREDVTLAPEARSATLSWDGRQGAVAYVVPRSLAPPLPPGQRRVRPTAVGVPASTDDPFGPPASSGGSVALLPLDADGNAASPARTVFTENARLWRATLVREPDAWAVAWTGATVTDDEVRGTVRAIRVRDDGALTRPMAAATGFSGDPGDGLRLVRVEDATVLAFTGSRCFAREGEPPPPPSLNDDPSNAIDPPARSPQPQGPVRRAPGPPIECGPTSLHLSELRANDAFGPLLPGPWMRSDAAAFTADSVFAPLARSPSAQVFARVALRPRGFGALVDVASGEAFALGARPTVSPASVENRARPAPDSEPPPRVRAVAPPAVPPEEPLDEALSTPRALAASPDGRALLAVTSDRRGIVLVRAGAALLATSPSLFHEVAVLDAGAAPTIALSREGVWSGPVRWFALPASGAPTTVALGEARAAPPPPRLRPTRYPTTNPLRYDPEFSRLFAQTRLYRAQFMRHENLAGMMAARPEAPTDPRMPGLIAVRTRLRSRWESSCGQLRARASTLARAGAGDDVLQGVQQLCEIHADLQLGVPVNPAL